MKTEQESFWAGEFGDSYIDRNKSDQLLSSNTHYFSQIFSHAQKINSCLELGANIGMNLVAIKRLLPECTFTAVEINSKACEFLRKIEKTEVLNKSILELELNKKFDFVFTKGVMIHLNPDFLKDTYTKMYNASSKYICIGEYFNPSPTMIEYRGNKDRLFKRDFAGEMMDMFPDLRLVHYEFCYNRDNTFPQDNITWFLMEKTK